MKTQFQRVWITNEERMLLQSADNSNTFTVVPATCNREDLAELAKACIHALAGTDEGRDVIAYAKATEFHEGPDESDETTLEKDASPRE